jgi:hypothetical protein
MESKRKLTKKITQTLKTIRIFYFAPAFFGWAKIPCGGPPCSRPFQQSVYSIGVARGVVWVLKHPLEPIGKIIFSVS